MSVWAITCRLLAKYLQSGTRLDFLLETLPGQLPAVDRRRCRRLLFGAVRNLGLLEFAIDEHLRSRPRAILKAALLLGAFEILEDPESKPVIIHHTVERTRELASASEARVVNAVLRKVPATLDAEKNSTDMSAAALSRRLSHPEWLVERWIGHFGIEATKQLLEWNQNPAIVHARRIEIPGIETSPLPEGFEATEHPGFFRVARPDWEQVEALLAAGRIYLQDPATAIAPGLLSVSTGETVLDVCAAPGGKTLQLAERVGDRGRVVALDLRGTRLGRLQENLARHASLPISVFGHDATKVQSTDLEAAGLPGLFDAALVDAACSNTGVLRHRVDAKWRLRPVDLKKLPRLQQNILRNVARLVRPGGRLVYSTCSLEPEENQGVIDAFLERGDGSFALEDSKASHPWESGCDGAGTFLLRKTGASDS